MYIPKKRRNNSDEEKETPKSQKMGRQNSSNRREKKKFCSRFFFSLKEFQNVCDFVIPAASFSSPSSLYLFSHFKSNLKFFFEIKILYSKL